MSIRLAVDVGGTFTDAVYFNDTSKEARAGKRPSTPSALEQGVLDAIGSVLDGEPLADAEFFFHGTTVGLNSLLQRRGPTIGLLATRGFSDALEIGRGEWSAYDLRYAAPPPLVPRRLRQGVTERIGAGGDVLTPLERADVGAALAVFEEAGVESIAVAFLNSYVNPEHELLAEHVLRELGFEGEVSLSHAISGEYREYERTSTTVVDVYVRPLMSTYLARLADGLTSAGFNGAMLITRSGGGAIPFAQAAKRPVDTILSGPVGGVQGAAALARDLGLGAVITADMGGTSFETGLISDGQPTTIYRGMIGGFPILTPWVDVRTIGAGGGSIAFVDEGGLLRVGPRSAGADPGPAAYGRGGVEPTVSDAAFALGMFGTDELAGGIKLHHDRATHALATLVDPLNMNVQDVARGVVTIATANMANAIREITVERGEDPRVSTLMPFGGAGPLFATLLADELEISEIVVPPHAGNFSAWGLLGADIVHSAARTRLLPITSPGLVSELAAEAERLFDELSLREGVGEGRWDNELSLDVRYVGQEHSLTLEVEMHDGLPRIDADGLGGAFRREYAEVFGHSIDEPIEIVSLRATVRKLLPHAELETIDGDARGERRRNTSSAYSFVSDDWSDFQITHRELVTVGDTLVGPVIVLDPISTMYVDVGFAATVHPSGSIVIGREQGQK
jgi:N-methylhydantoinase A